jgi:hypothetical protein
VARQPAPPADDDRQRWAGRSGRREWMICARPPIRPAQLSRTRNRQGAAFVLLRVSYMVTVRSGGHGPLRAAGGCPSTEAAAHVRRQARRAASRYLPRSWSRW